MLDVGNSIFFVLLRRFDHLGIGVLGSNNIAKMESYQKANQQKAATTTGHVENADEDQNNDICRFQTKHSIRESPITLLNLNRYREQKYHDHL